MDEAEWMTVLRVFWEDNLAFEYEGDPEDWITYFPERDDLENIDPTVHLEDLRQAGYLEVREIDLSDDDTVAIDGFRRIQISERGIKTVLEWEKTKSQQRWERDLLDKQEQYERDRLRRQQKFEKNQVTSENNVNAAIGYLTAGLLIITFIDAFLSDLKTFSGRITSLP